MRLCFTLSTEKWYKNLLPRKLNLLKNIKGLKTVVYKWLFWKIDIKRKI